MTSLTIRRPDDMHLHLRDGEMMRAVLPETARHFARALIMPNLVPPVVTARDARAYLERIQAALPDGASFTPLMTLYLTEATDPSDLAAAAADGLVTAVKLYPAGATTNSASGVRDIDAVMPVLEKMAAIGLPLCVHGEVTDAEIDIFDREAVFIERILAPLRQRLPELKIVMEHITTAEGAAFVQDGPDGIGGTLTVQHLLLNRNALLAGGIRPHYYCLPILKAEMHRKALVEAATSGNPRFFLGTDSAPHPDGAKLAACGCAGCFTAPIAMACLAALFEELGVLDRLEPFTSEFGARYYGLALNDGTLTLEKLTGALPVPPPIHADADTVTVFDPARPLLWTAA